MNKSFEGVEVGEVREWVDEWGEKDPVIVVDLNSYPYKDCEDTFTEIMVKYMRCDGTICEMDIMNFNEWTRNITQ